MTAPYGLWLQCRYPRTRALHKLVCFPHAGGSAAFFRNWGNLLPECEVHAVRYPGRAERIDEPTPKDLLVLSENIAEAISFLLPSHSVALFGHSLGAVIALETARFLAARGIKVTHIFASGSRAGCCPNVGPQISDRVEDDDTISDRMVTLGGTDPKMAADPLFRALVLPYIRSDTHMYHAYVMQYEPRLTCGVTTIVGDADCDADHRPWRMLTTGHVSETVVSGNHFYLASDPPFDVIRARLG